MLRFEPFILAAEARSMALGQAVIACAREAGFRESGATTGVGQAGAQRTIIGLRCSIRLEVGGATLLSSAPAHCMFSRCMCICACVLCPSSSLHAKTKG